MASRLLRPRLPNLGFSLRRRIHNLPPLEQFQNGIPGLMTADGFRIAWTEYQTVMLEKINALTAGSPDDYSSTPKNLLLKYARSPTMASLFNHASMAHNNHFFFSCLSSSSDPIPVPPALQKALETSFHSMATLRADMIATANAIFGPGFVWLVKTKDGKYSILSTYIAGSPYPGAHWRRQPRDMNTETRLFPSGQEPQTEADLHRMNVMSSLPIANSVGAHGPLSNSPGKLAPGGIDVIPVLCVSTWQHMYLLDWGVMQKKEYLEAWWERIDWNVVAANAGLYTTIRHTLAEVLGPGCRGHIESEDEAHGWKRCVWAAFMLHHIEHTLRRYLGHHLASQMLVR